MESQFLPLLPKAIPPATSLHGLVPQHFHFQPGPSWSAHPPTPTFFQHTQHSFSSISLSEFLPFTLTGNGSFSVKVGGLTLPSIVLISDLLSQQAFLLLVHSHVPFIHSYLQHPLPSGGQSPASSASCIFAYLFTPLTAVLVLSYLSPPSCVSPLLLSFRV